MARQPLGYPPYNGGQLAAESPQSYQTRYSQELDEDGGDDGSPGSYAKHVNSGDDPERHCTDVYWIIPFTLLMGALVYVVLTWAPHNHHDISLRRLENWRGQVCGAGNQTGRNYLYFCMREPGRLEVFHPECVAACPRNWDARISCFNENRSGPGGTGRYLNTSSYPTHIFQGQLCVPHLNETLKQKWDLHSQMSEFIHQDSWMGYVSMFHRAWAPLMMSAIVAFVASLTYVVLLRRCASYLVYLGLLVLSAMPLGLGIYLLVMGKRDIDSGRDMDFEESVQELVIGALSTAVGLSFGCYVWKEVKNIEVAIECIIQSCECIMTLPSLLIAPLFVLAGWVGTCVLLRPTLRQAVLIRCRSMAEEEQALNLTEIATAVFILLIFIWLIYLVYAIGGFAEAYATREWMRKHARGTEEAFPCCTTVRGIGVGLRYHFGTFIYSSLVICLIEPVRLAVVLVRFVTPCELKLGMLGWVVDHLSRDAYCAVIAKSLPFWQAAQVASDDMKDDEACEILSGATWVFRIAGNGAIAWLGYMVTWFVLSVCARYRDVTNVHYVQYGKVECLAGAFCAALVALPFMNLLGLVSDSILYWRQEEESRKHLLEQGALQDESWWLSNMISNAGGSVPDQLGCYCGFRPKAKVADGAPRDWTQ